MSLHTVIHLVSLFHILFCKPSQYTCEVSVVVGFLKHSHRAISHVIFYISLHHSNLAREAKAIVTLVTRAVRWGGASYAMDGQGGGQYGGTAGNRSKTRSKSRSRARGENPTWMECTAERLEAAAHVAEMAAQEGGADSKALYVMSAGDVVQAASSQPRTDSISRSEAYMAAASEPKSHVETSYELHRLTAGGYKLPELRTGPFATALNPNRHAMMIQGRPVMVPC